MKNIKKLGLVFAVTIITMLFFALSTSASWEKITPSSDIEYYFDEITGTLHIRGEGKIPNDLTGNCRYDDDFDDDEFDDYYEDNESSEEEKKKELTDIMADVKTVIIGEGITEIGHCAFKGYEGFKNLEAAVLPQSLEKIGEYAFGSCQKLTTVNLPSNLKEIESEAFQNTGIKNIVFPESLIYLGAAFNSSALESVYIPENVEKIEGSAFNWCNNLKKITFTKAVCSVVNCNALEEIVYPADYGTYNYEYYHYFMAENCPNLKKITFPAVEKNNNVKILKTSYGTYVKNCPKVTLGNVNSDMIKYYIDHIVVSKGVSTLGKVASVKRSQTSKESKLTWSAVEGAGYYQVYRWNEDTQKWEKSYSGGATEYLNPVSGKYKVRAVNYDGEKYVYGKYSSVIEFKALYGDIIRRATVDGTSVKIKWSQSAGQTGFQVYSSAKRNSGYAKVGTTSKYSFTVNNLVKGKTYYFKIREYYKYSDGTIAYGPFSDVVKVKI